MRDGSRPAAIVGLLVVCITLLSLSFRPRGSLPEIPLTEDGYYQLSVARNIALGNGITVDGSLRTNGFQPLFTLACVPLYMVTGGDRLATLRLVLILHSLLYLLTAYLIGCIARDVGDGEDSPVALRFIFAISCYFGSSYLLMQHHNGLETGLTLFLYAVVWRYYQRNALHSTLHCILGGSLLGLLVLSRIDAVFLLVAVSLGGLFLPGTFTARCTRFLTTGGVAFLVSSPWWLYNLWVFGSLMPISGQAQQKLGISTFRVYSAFSALCQTCTPYLVTTRDESSVFIFLRFLVLTGFILSIRRRRIDSGRVEIATPFSGDRITWTDRFGVQLLVTCGLLAGYYTLDSWACHFYERYFAPLALIAVVTWSCVLARATRLRPFLIWLVPGLAFLELMGAVTALNTARVFAGNCHYEDQLRLVNRHVPAGERVGAHQSGTLGYFRDAVLNLDGKVNSKALRNRDRIPEYLEEEKVDWYCDWQFFAPGPPEGHGWYLVDRAGQSPWIFLLFRRHPRTEGCDARDFR